MKPSILEIRRVEAMEKLEQKVAALEEKVDRLLELLESKPAKTAKAKPVADEAKPVVESEGEG